MSSSKGKPIRTYSPEDLSWLKNVVLPPYSDEGANQRLANRFNNERGGIPISWKALRIKVQRLQGKYLPPKTKAIKKVERVRVGSRPNFTEEEKAFLKANFPKGPAGKSYWKKLTRKYNHAFQARPRSVNSIEVKTLRLMRAVAHEGPKSTRSHAKYTLRVNGRIVWTSRGLCRRPNVVLTRLVQVQKEEVVKSL